MCDCLDTQNTHDFNCNTLTAQLERAPAASQAKFKAIREALTEGWASLDGHAVAVGHYQGGELHPSRVFNR